jgi:HAD superfamily hydrolase (TIGR01509 family)
MALDGFIFDLDGTLVDSNATHIEAWRRAFSHCGYTIGIDRIAVEVGKGGDSLVPAILGECADQKDGETLRKTQPREFEKLVSQSGLRVFPGARELLSAMRRKGIATALATSSGKKQIRTVEKGCGFAVSEAVDLVVNSDDIQTSKPAPDLVHAAVKNLRMTPAQTAMLGDTPYDGQACRGAGVVCLGLTCGGNRPDHLLSAGARAVWTDPADLLAHLDEALSVASPGPHHLTEDVLERLMREALAAAREGMNAGEVPIGAVLARSDGSIIARGFNELNRTQNKTAHAEMVTFGRAQGKVPADVRDRLLVSTLEPCVMCLGAAMEASVDTIVYALQAPADSGTGRVTPPQSPGTLMPRIVGGLLADESRGLFREWLNKPGNNPEQIAFVQQLLALTCR